MSRKKSRKSSKKTAIPMVLKICLKCIAICLIVFLLCGLTFGTASIILELGSEGLTKKEGIRYCDYDYYEKKYGELRDTLQLFKLYDEEYDIYWEIADGYKDYIEYYQWKEAAKEGFVVEEDKVSYYKEKVINNAKNCRFEKNKKVLQEYADEVTND